MRHDTANTVIYIIALDLLERLLYWSEFT